MAHSGKNSNAFKAGVVVLVALAIGVFFYLSSRSSTLNTSTAKKYVAYLENASGLNAKSLVTVAGLQVGVIQSIELKSMPRKEFYVGQANVEAPEQSMSVAELLLLINNEIQLPEDTLLRKETLGLLGSNAVFLDLGVSSNMLEDGDRIRRVKGEGGFEAMASQMGGLIGRFESFFVKVEDNLSGIVSDIKGITGQLNAITTGSDGGEDLAVVYRRVLGEIERAVNVIGDAVEGVDQLVGENDGSITQLLANVNAISKDFRQMTESGPNGGGDLRATIASIRGVASDLSMITGKVREVIGENEEEIEGGIEELSTTLEELNRSLASLSEITGKIERGEGAAGKILTDKNLGDKVEAAIAGASDYIDAVTSLEFHVDGSSFYNFRRGNANTSIQLRIQPRPDRYYFFEFVQDGGAFERMTRTFNTTDAITGEQITREQIFRFDNRVRFSAMLAKVYFDILALRIGFLESSGAVGFDFLLFNERLKIRNDIFNFSGPRNSVVFGDPSYPGIALPRWRTMVKWQPVPYVYLMGGVDDVLNTWNWNRGGQYLQRRNPAIDGFGFDYFFGAGLMFRDDELRTILPFLPGL